MSATSFFIKLPLFGWPKASSTRLGGPGHSGMRRSLTAGTMDALAQRRLTGAARRLTFQDNPVPPTSVANRTHETSPAPCVRSCARTRASPDLAPEGAGEGAGVGIEQVGRDLRETEIGIDQQLLGDLRIARLPRGRAT